MSQPNRTPAASRWSRLITIGAIGLVALVIGVVLLTSERDGPGSTQPQTTANDAQPTPAPTTQADAAAATAITDTSARAEAAAAAAAPPTAVPAVGGCAATATMPGGDNFYVRNAPQVTSLGTGLVVEGTVREAGTCQPVRNARIQIWLNTARGGEGEASNRGSVLTDENGHYRLETAPVVPQFGQPHVHIAYDDGRYDSVFLRSVMPSKDIPAFTVDFVLAPSDDG